MHDLISDAFFSILAAGFFVGVVVGLTGMGGGALMTPALIFLGVGDAATVVTADLTAAAIYKSGGAIVHKREGSPNMRLAMAPCPPAMSAPCPATASSTRLPSSDQWKYSTQPFTAGVAAIAARRPAPAPKCFGSVNSAISVINPP